MINTSIDSNSIRSAQGSERPKPADLFKKIDADGDGSVSKQEFESSFVDISKQGSDAADADTDALKAKADEIYASIDSDGDGQLSASEFETAAKAHGPQGQGQPPQGAPGGTGGNGGHGGGPQGAGGAGSTEKKDYDPADTNRDGTVSAEEAAAYEAQEAIKAYNAVADAS